MDKLKLKWRIFTFLFGFCALLILILWFFQTVLLTDMYKLIRRMEVDGAIRLVEENINSLDLQLVLGRLETEKEILVMQTHEFDMPERGRPDQYRRKMESVTKTKEFILADGSTISLTFHAMISPVDATVSTLQFQLYIIIGIMLFCSVILAVIIARHISRPIEVISKNAKKLAAGNYDTHFTGHGFLEIKELSDTLNTAAAELSKVENLRRELMANISHDLRTPLSLIYSYAEMMHDFPEEIVPEQTQTIMDESKRLTSLVNDVLDVSRLETGTIELNITTYNLTESLKDTVRQTAELVKMDGWHILFEYEDEVYVNADQVKINQAFYNLLTNAIHYSTTDKNILVKQEIRDRQARIEVIDHGDGILEENLPHIWERYYKVDKRHKRAIAGTGLGLSIVKKILELHGGTYGVRSEVSKGSTFWFEIPLS